MKITLEHSNQDEYSRKVTIETTSDDMIMDELAEVLAQACVAIGYHPDSVSNYIVDNGFPEGE